MKCPSTSCGRRPELLPATPSHLAQGVRVVVLPIVLHSKSWQVVDKCLRHLVSVIIVIFIIFGIYLIPRLKAVVEALADTCVEKEGALVRSVDIEEEGEEGDIHRQSTCPWIHDEGTKADYRDRAECGSGEI
jgi:hypothetical protein